PGRRGTETDVYVQSHSRAQHEPEARRTAQSVVRWWNARHHARPRSAPAGIARSGRARSCSSPSPCAHGGRGCAPTRRIQRQVPRHWELPATKHSDLRFELVDVLAGADCLALYYRGHRGLAADTFFFSGGEQVMRATACYSISP